jgi:hypothetical protein
VGIFFSWGYSLLFCLATLIFVSSSFLSFLPCYRILGALKQGSDGEGVFPMCGVFPFATRIQPLKHEGYVKVSQVLSCYVAVNVHASCIRTTFSYALILVVYCLLFFNYNAAKVLHNLSDLSVDLNAFELMILFFSSAPEC